MASILATQLHIQENVPDTAVWKPNNKGVFSVSSAWRMIREKREVIDINKLTWQRYIPFKYSFLLWRALRGKLPTNEKLSKFGQDPRECCCVIMLGWILWSISL